MSDEHEDVDKILSESEVGALLKLVGSEDASNLAPAELAEHAEPYDFRQRNQLSPEHRALLEEAVARASAPIGQALARQLREPCAVRAGTWAAPTAGDLLASCAESMVFALDLEPGGGKALLAIPRAFVGRAVDRMLGGLGVAASAQREPTRAELVLVGRLVRSVLDPLRASLGESSSLQLAAAHYVASPQLAPVVDPAEGLVCQDLELADGGGAHTLRFALTARSLGTSGRLAPGVEAEPPRRPSELAPDSPFGQLPLKVVAVLAESRISTRW